MLFLAPPSSMRLLRCTPFLLTALLLGAAPSWGQAPSGRASVAGTVTDAETGEPLSDVNVIAAGSQRGTVTDENGRYVLDGLPLGAQRIYFSYVGYESLTHNTLLREPRRYAFDAALSPSVLEMEDVTVESERDAQWERRLERFTRLFIGETPNAGQTEIVNPAVLNFAVDGGAFKARAAETLVIENQALGYRIRYFLKEFEALPTGRTRYDGEPLFEQMEPSSPAQAAEWQKNRRDAYRGSLRHFLRALVAGEVESEGFKMYNLPASRSMTGGSPFGGPPGGGMRGRQRFPVDRGDILEDGEADTEKMLDFQGFVQVTYTGEMEDEAYLRWRGERRRPKYRSGRIEVEEGPTIVDYKGDMLDPYGVTQYDYYAFERVADQVPREYGLDE